MKPGQLLKRFVKRNQGGPPQLAIPLTKPVAAGLLVVLLCVIGWAFFMGWMVGAGQNPQASLEKITGMGAESQDASPEPEESVAVAVAPEAAEEDGEKGPEQFARPSGEQLSAWPDAGVVPAEKTVRKAEKPQQRRQPEARASGARFDFSYQVAAFKTKQEADQLAQRLNKGGIRSSARKSGKVFLVLASLRGTDADARAMIAKLRGMKLGEPLRLARKPLQQGGKQ